MSRASARETSDVEPSPISRRRPCTIVRSAQDIEVVAHDATDQWAAVKTTEWSGWVALRDLA